MAGKSFQSLTQYVLSSPLLAIGIVLAFSGISWAAVDLCSRHPWLVLIGASCACLLGHCAIAIRYQGILGLLPDAAANALGRPVFELLRIVAVDGVIVGVNTVRLLLLAIGDLDEEQTKQVLEELSEDFRHDCFQKPSLALLPRWLQHTLLGSSNWEHKWDLRPTEASVLSNDGKPIQLEFRGTPSTNDGSDGEGVDDGRPKRKLSKDSSASAEAQGRISDLLQQLRSAESAARGIEVPKLQKVLHEKISDYTVAALRNGVVNSGKRRVDTTRKVVNQMVTRARTADIGENLSRLVNTSPRDIIEARPEILSRACVLTWAAISFPFRVTSAAISVSFQGFCSLLCLALDLARGAGCSRRNTELVERWTNDLNGMLSPRPRTAPAEIKESEPCNDSSSICKAD